MAATHDVRHAPYVGLQVGVKGLPTQNSEGPENATVLSRTQKHRRQPRPDSIRRASSDHSSPRAILRQRWPVEPRTRATRPA